MAKKKKEVEVFESTSIGDDFAGASAEVTVGDQLDQIVNEAESEDEGHSTMGKDATEKAAKAAQEIKERADKAARLAEQRAREEAVRAAKKLAAEKAAAEAEAKLAAEEAKKRAEHAERIAIRQATVEKAANKLKDQFKF